MGPEEGAAAPAAVAMGTTGTAGAAATAAGESEGEASVLWQ